MKQVCFTIMLAVNVVTTGVCGAGFWHLSGRIDRLVEYLTIKKIDTSFNSCYADEIKGGNDEHGISTVTAK